MEITEKVTGSTLVRAGINEKKFFERIGVGVTASQIKQAFEVVFTPGTTA